MPKRTGKAPSPVGEFKTTLLPLSAYLLAACSQIVLAGIGEETNADGKRLIRLQFPIERESDVRRLVEEFLNNTAVINVANYGRCLNRLRSLVKSNQRSTEQPALAGSPHA